MVTINYTIKGSIRVSEDTYDFEEGLSNEAKIEQVKDTEADNCDEAALEDAANGNARLEYTSITIE